MSARMGVKHRPSVAQQNLELLGIGIQFEHLELGWASMPTTSAPLILSSKIVLVIPSVFFPGV